MITKPRVVKDYNKISDSIKDELKKAYPMGYSKRLVKFKNATGDWISALPFETEDKSYLIKMTKSEANTVPSNESDKMEEMEEEFEAIIASNDGSIDQFNFDEEE